MSAASLDPLLPSRQAALVARVGAPVLLVSNGRRVRNLPLNGLPYRADSTFLAFTGCAEEGAAALLDGDGLTLFLTPPEPDDVLWHGAVESLEERRARYGADRVLPLDALAAEVAARPGVVSLPVPDPAMTALAAQLTGLPLTYPQRVGPTPASDALIDAVIAIRRARSPWELEQMRRAAAVSTAAHLTAMRLTRPGQTEAALAAAFDAVLAARHATPAYQSIVTVRGEVLHNHHYPNRLEAGQLLLLDGGAEVESGLASDVTRTWPVSGRFSPEQRDLYQLVLDAQTATIAGCVPGARYRALHEQASRILAAGLRDMGLLRCAPDEALETGAVGVFFPHGLGHLIGYDVHDLENFGDRPAYAPGRSRPTTFGARNLRMDLDLEPDVVVTIEPGIYIVPAILRDAGLRAELGDRVAWDKALALHPFGGIRIEDDVRVQASGAPEVLTAAIPKEIAALEAVVGSGLGEGGWDAVLSG